MHRPAVTGLVLASLLACGDARAPSPPPSAPPSASPPAGEPAPALPARAPSAAERVVQAQLDAYNRRDLDAFAATFAPDARGYAYPDRPLFTGQRELRAVYGALFSSASALRATVLERIVQGNVVIDHEEVTGTRSGEAFRAVAIYEVRDGRIASVRLIR